MEKFLGRIFGYGEGKFSELNTTLNERDRYEAALNEILRDFVSQLEKALNEFYGTKGTVSVFDWESKSKKRVPLIHIATDMDRWDTFAPNGKITLNVIFHFDSAEYIERIEAIYSESAINIVVGKYTCTSIEEFCYEVEKAVKDSLRL
ncbi:hypothetical protein [Enterovibrio nigricans]|uniref:Uncharacterized protein n=1 Tax=Enterovibrio nigricans DSM 22720 TaxID=1121868 RepID=A0A1T4W1S6_9GAMM|nr:hypothetical protein [Enterovibrio nigricans]PKF49012.1 hypothetical protein AT251_22020 [Enterovibrio nigricans]SKA71193.1 hypothetical protein SAMN02745132_04667 [Enterovibrio nigricans DSM 22720]